MGRKLINALGGLAVIVGLAGGVDKADASDTLRNAQRRNFAEYREEGRQEYPVEAYFGNGIFRAGLWSVHPVKRTVQETHWMPKEVWERIDCNGRIFFEQKVILEPQIRKREELLGYYLHCNKEGDVWYKGGEKDNLCLHKGYERAKIFKEKLCKEAKRHGKVLKEDLRDLRHDVERGGCKVLEGVGDVLSFPFYVGGAVLGEVGEGLDKLGSCSNEYHPHPIPGNLDPYRAPVPWSTHPHHRAQGKRFDDLYLRQNANGEWVEIENLSLRSGDRVEVVPRFGPDGQTAKTYFLHSGTTWRASRD